jgi:hypothetical protein
VDDAVAEGGHPAIAQASELAVRRMGAGGKG